MVLACDAAEVGDEAAATEPNERPHSSQASSLPFGDVPPGVVASHDANKIGTTNSGIDYIEECLNVHGVPIPWTVLDPAAGWVNHGVIADPFEAPGWDAELWTWESNDPDGVCMALPRWSGNNAMLLGVICLGRATSRTCFWDNPSGTFFQKNTPIPIDNFVGGFALDANLQGRCSDCHAGENPFVVHPDDAAFESAKVAVNLEPLSWPRPVVPALPDWPGNPGPIQKLGSTASGEQRCDTCHVKGNAGRFPLVSQALPSYCSRILQPAIAANGTMPPSPFDHFDVLVDYASHREWLLAACGSSSGSIEPVTPPSTVTLSPPIIHEPLYACAEHVVVSGYREDASRLALYVDSQFVAEEFYLKGHPVGYQTVFSLSQPLVEGQVVQAIQELGTVVSDFASVTVRDHTDDYPQGLPAPEITPVPLYECATAIAVANIPNVELFITKTTSSGTTVYPRKTWASHTWAGGLGPAFEVGDTFRVRQSLCSDVSPDSETVEVEAAPATVPPPKFDPEPLMEGQSVVTVDGIVQGASLAVWDYNLGFLWWHSSVPYNRVEWIDVAWGLGEPIGPQHSLHAGQWLNGCTPISITPVAVGPCNDETLVLNVEIAQPQDGDDFVVVTKSVPGSILRVLDATEEIGNGSGPVIALTRQLVSNEVISVVQELGTCTSTFGYTIVVL
jgi:hypothetical protein